VPRWHASRQWEGKQQVAPEGDKEEGMEFHNAKRAFEAVYGHSEFDSDSSNNKRRKQLHIMYDGSSDITSKRIIKMFALGGGSSCTCVESGAPPQVDGDVDHVQRL
jgi:hypothetical protein